MHWLFHLLSLVAITVLALRLGRYRQRAKTAEKVADDFTPRGLSLPALRVGEVWPELGDDRTPEPQPLLQLPWPGWDEDLGWGTAEDASIARLAGLFPKACFIGRVGSRVGEIYLANAQPGARLVGKAELFEGDEPVLLVFGQPLPANTLLAASRAALGHAAPGSALLWSYRAFGVKEADAQAAALHTLSVEWPLVRLHGTRLLVARGGCTPRGGPEPARTAAGAVPLPLLAESSLPTFAAPAVASEPIPLPVPDLPFPAASDGAASGYPRSRAEPTP